MDRAFVSTLKTSQNIQRNFFKAISDTEALGDNRWQIKRKWIHAIGSGVAEGSCRRKPHANLCASLGTPYAVDMHDKILLLEDVTRTLDFDHIAVTFFKMRLPDRVKGSSLESVILCAIQH